MTLKDEKTSFWKEKGKFRRKNYLDNKEEEHVNSVGKTKSLHN